MLLAKNVFVWWKHEKYDFHNLCMKDMISLQKCMSIMIFMIWVWYHGDNFELEGKCIDLMKNAFMVWLCALNWFMHYLMILGQECEIKIRERSLGWKTQNLAKRRCSLRVNKPIKHKQGLGALMTLTIGMMKKPFELIWCELYI